MSAPTAPWTLACPWCPYSVLVNARGGRGADQGAGVEASDLMRAHVEDAHSEDVDRFPLGAGRVIVRPVPEEPRQLFAPPDPVLAASRWPDNAALIADCARLGYLREDWLTMDATYGLGKFWTRWKPAELVAHDEDSEKGDGVSFLALPEPDWTYDAAVFDPAYMAPGGRDKSTVGEFNDRFGLHTTPPKPDENQQKMNAGLTEVARVVKPRGFVLVKCMDYVNGGKLWLGTHHTLTHGLSIGLELFDRLEHVGRTGPQSQTRQVHARRNLSTLFVFRKSRAVLIPEPETPTPAENVRVSVSLSEPKK